MHGKEGYVEADEGEPKIQLADRLAHHAAGYLRKPVVDGSDKREHGAADQHVMEMRDHKIRVVHLRIDRHRGDHHAGHSTQHENEDEPEHEEHRRAQYRFAVPQGGKAAEDPNSARYGDHHARCGEEALTEAR